MITLRTPVVHALLSVPAVNALEMGFFCVHHVFFFFSFFISIRPAMLFELLLPKPSLMRRSICVMDIICHLDRG